MKTNVVMLRSMGDFKVTQRTKDSMFNATALLKQWNSIEKSKHGKSHIKNVADFLRLGSTKTFIDTIIETEECTTKNVISVHKGKYGGTWMHPFLFIDFAMWINPKFKYTVIQFVYDELIKQRHDAGDNYKILSRAGVKLKGYNYPEVAKALQWIVFNKTGKGLRQLANQKQLEELNQIQTKLAFAIDMGYIKTYKHLVQELRRIWEQKYKQPQISA